MGRVRSVSVQTMRMKSLPSKFPRSDCRMEGVPHLQILYLRPGRVARLESGKCSDQRAVAISFTSSIPLHQNSREHELPSSTRPGPSNIGHGNIFIGARSDAVTGMTRTNASWSTPYLADNSLPRFPAIALNSPLETHAEPLPRSVKLR